MLKYEVKYDDFDGKSTVETIWFHMTKAEIAKALIKDDNILDRWQRTLKSDDKIQFINMFDELVRMSVGIRTPEGGFRKPVGYGEEFLSTEAYSSMFIDMFSDETGRKAANFFMGVFPNDIINEAKKQLLERDPVLAKQLAELEAGEGAAVTLAPEKLGHEYSVDELKAMTDDQFQQWERRTPPQVMRQDQIQYAYIRKTSQR